MRTGRGAATIGPAGPRHAGGRGAVPIVASARVSLLSPCARARGQCGDPERKWPLHSEPTAWPGGGVAGMSVTGRCDEHHRHRGLGPEGPAGRGAGVRLTSCVRPDSPASPARVTPSEQRLLSPSGSLGPAGRATTRMCSARGFQKRPSVLLEPTSCQAAAPRGWNFQRTQIAQCSSGALQIDIYVG